VTEPPESRWPSHLGFRISFARRECRRCGGERIAGQACPECGARPDEREIDPALQRRMRVAKPVLAAFREPDEHLPSEMTLESVLSASADIVPRFLTALGALHSRGEDASELLSAVSALQDLRSQVERDRTRPWRRMGRAVRGLLGEISESLKLFATAFQADDPLTAQRVSAAAQAALDSAAVRAEQINSDCEVMERLFEATPEDFLPLAAELAVGDLPELEDASSTLLALDAYGARYVRRIIGVESEPGPGLGLGVMMSVVVAEVLLDGDRVYQVANQAYQAYLHESLLRKLGSDPDWVVKQHDAQISLQDGIRNLHALLLASLNDRTAVRAVLFYVQDLIEGSAKHLLATFLAIRKGRNYQQCMRADSNALLQQCRQATRVELFRDLSEQLRNASAHLTYLIDGDEIILNPDTYEVRWSSATFMDKALATAESVLALNLALACALNHFDLDSAASPDLAALGLEPLGLVLAVLTVNGWEGPTFEIQDAVGKARGVASMRSPMTLAGTMLRSLPEEVRTLELSVVSDGSARTFVVDLTPLRRREATPPTSDEGELERDLAFVEACATATLNGQPFLASDAVRHYIAVRAGERINGDLGPAVRRLKQLRALALRLDDQECADVLLQVTRGVRLIAQGLAPEAEVKRGIDTLADWERRSFAQPFAA
jgi:hypothetical protein